jgi:hypothetical protein
VHPPLALQLRVLVPSISRKHLDVSSYSNRIYVPVSRVLGNEQAGPGIHGAGNGT